MNAPIIRTSERRALKRCPWMWYQAWRMGLKPLGEMSDALWFGTLVHAALAEWYSGPGLKRGAHPAETFAKLAAEEIRWIKTEARSRQDNVTTWIEEKLEPAEALGFALLADYVEHWGRDDSWHVIQPEHSGQVDVHDPDDPSILLAIYAFTYDLVFRDLEDDSIWLGEHKTAKAIRLDHLPLDDQAGSYWAVAPIELRASGLIGPKDRVKGIMYNFIRKAFEDDRPRNADGHYCNKPVKLDYAKALGYDGTEPEFKKMKIDDLETLAAGYRIEVFGEVSKIQPKPRFVREPVMRSPRERQTQIDRIRGEAMLMDEYRTGALPLIKNPTNECSWCAYHSMCLLDERGDIAAVAEYRSAMYRTQDPYADHRKSTEEDS